MPLLRSLLDSLSNRSRRQSPVEGSIRLSVPQRPARTYAIGDVHGCLDQLLDLERQIIADADEVEGEKWIVHLGDYVDRGPQSAQVIDHLLAPPPPGFRRICLRGNHEAVMLAALHDPAELEQWLSLGGDATLVSYGISAAQVEALFRSRRVSASWQILQAHIPDEHLRFLRDLVSVLSVPGYIFVHAGLRPGIALAEQRERDMLWIRDDFLDADYDFGAVVVHGHTPMRDAVVSAHRIGIDTGCFMTGCLTALRLDADGTTRLLQARRG